MAKNTEKPRRRPGRPTKEEVAARALAEAGCDPDAVDPRRILASIAVDGSMPPTARVAACKALLGVRDQGSAEESDAADQVNVRAVAKLMRVN